MGFNHRNLQEWQRHDLPIERVGTTAPGDKLGAILIDPIAGRTYRLCQLKDGVTASRGCPVGVASQKGSQATFKATADISKTYAENFLGIVAAESTVKSGHYFWAMTDGPLGSVPSSPLYNGAIQALTDGDATIGKRLIWGDDKKLSTPAELTKASVDAVMSKGIQATNAGASTATAASVSAGASLVAGVIFRATDMDKVGRAYSADSGVILHHGFIRSDLVG